MSVLDYQLRMKLIAFCCSFAWADLEIHPKERDLILRLMERLEIDGAEDRKRVLGWMRSPPPLDEIDPYSIPQATRELFVHECEKVIRVDGVIRNEETDALDLLNKVLFGDLLGVAGKLRGAPGAAARAEAPSPPVSLQPDQGAEPTMEDNDKKKIIEQMNKILQLELAGVSRYLHYSFLVFGPNRIPIVNFFRTQATEGITHAIMIGEKITSFGGHPTIRVETPPEPPSHDVRTLLEESLKFERSGVHEYRNLLKMAGDDIALEELTRSQIRAETEHCEEVEKMLRELQR